MTRALYHLLSSISLVSLDTTGHNTLLPFVISLIGQSGHNRPDILLFEQNLFDGILTGH